MNAWSRRVLLVDDDVLVRSLVGDLLQRSGFDVRSCSDVTQARQVVEEFDPDLAILDVNLGAGPTGVQLGYVLRQVHPGVGVMYLTRYPTALVTEPGLAEHIAESVVVSKDDVSDPEVLISAVEMALRGSRAAGVSEEGTDAAIRQLSRTQLQVLELLAQGLTNSSIAELRNTSERAVEKHVKLIYENLGLETQGPHNARVLAAKKFLEAMGATSNGNESSVAAR